MRSETPRVSETRTGSVATREQKRMLPPKREALEVVA